MRRHDDRAQPSFPAKQQSLPREAPPWVRICPNCGAILRERACKLSCPTPGCGFFLSCADFV